MSAWIWGRLLVPTLRMGTLLERSASGGAGMP